MPDYFGVISRSVAALDESTVTTRRALYDRALSAQAAQLRKINPPLSNADFDRECLALEDAIRRVEQTCASHQATTETKFRRAENITPPVLLSSADTSATKRILSIISSAAMTGLGVVVMLLLIAIPTTLVLGGIWASGKVLGYLAYPVSIALLLCVLVFLPLSFFRATRFIPAIGFQISSYLFGASAWFAGLLTSYTYFGLFWTVVALLMFGIGVVPLGIVGAIFHTDWFAAALLFGGLILTYSARAMGAWMAAKIESDQSFDQAHRPDGTVIRALKYCFSFSGRFNRKNFWIGNGILFVMTMVAGFAVETDNIIAVIVGSLLSIVCLISFSSIATKRLHDLGYSGLWLLAYFAVMTAGEIILPPQFRGYASILAIICGICLGAVPGEKNSNRFGAGFQRKMPRALQA